MRFLDNKIREWMLDSLVNRHDFLALGRLVWNVYNSFLITKKNLRYHFHIFLSWNGDVAHFPRIRKVHLWMCDFYVSEAIQVIQIFENCKKLTFFIVFVLKLQNWDFVNKLTGVRFSVYAYAKCVKTKQNCKQSVKKCLKVNKIRIFPNIFG